ncbi:WPE palindromic element domain-containing protein [Wolbachia endosymbiont of Anurida maritima]
MPVLDYSDPENLTANEHIKQLYNEDWIPSSRTGMTRKRYQKRPLLVALVAILSTYHRMSSQLGRVSSQCPDYLNPGKFACKQAN